MSASHDATATEQTGLLAKHHFLLRRLHSLSGIVPVGIFVIMHLFTNFQLMRGGDEFQHEVDFIHSTPALLFIEITLWGSIAFHAILGVMYMTNWLPNVRQYKYGDNWRYTLQRITGWIALIFIFLHIATLRWRWNIVGWDTPFYARGADGEPLAAATTAAALQYAWWVVVLYLVGALSVVFHWANGLWTAAITWGLTISVGAQKRWGYACAGLGAALTVFTIGAVVGAMSYDISEAEQQQIEKMKESGGSHHSMIEPDTSVVDDSWLVAETDKATDPQWAHIANIGSYSPRTTEEVSK